MITFEDAFAEVERSAAAALKAAGAIGTAARNLQKAAQEGDIGKIRRAAERLETVANDARQPLENAKAAWSYSDVDEKKYLSESYEAELRREAERAGLTVHARDARLLAYPSIIQILPNDLAVRIDRKKVTAIRPSYLVRKLTAAQARKSTYGPERFLASLLSAYKIIAGKRGIGSVIHLAQVYEAFTLLPGANSDYSRSDFARDLFMLDRSGVDRTRSGIRVSFPASTGLKSGGRNVFTFVSPDGEVVHYYSLKFTER